jgi:hypothetical protein
LSHTGPPVSRKQLRGQCFAPIPDPQPLPSSLLKKKWGNDRVIMSPFCESAAKLAALPLNRNFHALRQPHPYHHACANFLNLSLLHSSPRVCAMPGGSDLPLNFGLGHETFLVSFLCKQCFSQQFSWEKS